MTTQHDYAGAIEYAHDLEDYNEFAYMHWYEDHRAAILHALRLAEALQKGPSEGMAKAGWQTNGEPIETFKAMIEQLYKEISDDR